MRTTTDVEKLTGKQRALRLMEQGGIEAVCLDLPGESDVATTATLMRAPWVYVEDVRRNPIIGKMVLRALQNGPAALWKPRRRFYRPPLRPSV